MRFRIFICFGLLFIVILIVSLAFIWRKKNIPGKSRKLLPEIYAMGLSPKKKITSLGNELCAFFVGVNNFFADGNTTYRRGKSETELVELFPTEIQRETGPYFTIDILPITIWEAPRHETKNFFLVNRNLIFNLVDNAIGLGDGHGEGPGECNSIVVHFRCSDTPFLRHASYEFAKYKFYLHHIREFLMVERPPAEITILTNKNHVLDEKFSAVIEKYKQHLVEILAENFPGKNVSIRDNGSVLGDFQKMRKCRFLLAPSSSYSFCAALSGSQERAVLMKPRHLKDGPLLPTHMEYVESCSVHHELVNDYNDFDAVKALLMK